MTEWMMCIFCNELQAYLFESSHKDSCYVICNNCRARGPLGNKHKAVTEWERVLKLEAANERLREAVEAAIKDYDRVMSGRGAPSILAYNKLMAVLEEDEINEY